MGGAGLEGLLEVLGGRRLVHRAPRHLSRLMHIYSPIPTLLLGWRRPTVCSRCRIGWRRVTAGGNLAGRSAAEQAGESAVSAHSKGNQTYRRRSIDAAAEVQTSELSEASNPRERRSQRDGQGAVQTRKRSRAGAHLPGCCTSNTS